MASIYTRTDSHGIKKYYGSINHNNLRIRRYLGLTKKSAELALKKLEYEILFNSAAVLRQLRYMRTGLGRKNWRGGFNKYSMDFLPWIQSNF